MSQELNKAVDKIVHAQGMVSPMSRAELLKILRPVFASECDRLRLLVKTQKELIKVYEKAIALGDPDVWELYTKIKELENDKRNSKKSGINR